MTTISIEKKCNMSFYVFFFFPLCLFWCRFNLNLSIRRWFCTYKMVIKSNSREICVKSMITPPPCPFRRGIVIVVVVFGVDRSLQICMIWISWASQAKLWLILCCSTVFSAYLLHSRVRQNMEHTINIMLSFIYLKFIIKTRSCPA